MPVLFLWISKTVSKPLLFNFFKMPYLSCYALLNQLQKYATTGKGLKIKVLAFKTTDICHLFLFYA